MARYASDTLAIARVAVIAIVGFQIVPNLPVEYAIEGEVLKTCGGNAARNFAAPIMNLKMFLVKLNRYLLRAMAR